VIELPPIAMAMTPLMLPQGWCAACGTWTKAQGPSAYATGYGPRCSALMGEIAGIPGTRRRTSQDLCASVLRVPISLGAIQKGIDRVARAIAPHDETIARGARRRALYR
jgi:transposase